LPDDTRRRRILREYVDEREEPREEQPDTRRFQTLEPPVRVLTADRPTCGEPHGRVCLRMDHLELTAADHETRIRASERRGADVAGKFLWLFVTALVCGAVSLVVALLTAGSGG
jgi:hypothetical protein